MKRYSQRALRNGIHPSHDEAVFKNARELREMVQAAKTDDVKKELRMLAQQYDKLAGDVARPAAPALNRKLQSVL